MRLPQPKEIQDAFAVVFRSGATLDQLRGRAVANRLLHDTNAYEDGIPGRSLAWKLFMFPGPPLSTPVSPARLLNELHSFRREYVELLSDKMRAPDGGYEEGFTLPGPGQNQPVKRAKVDLGWETNNPLSLDDQNPWREWFAALELRKTIAQDVDRTFPDIEYFRSPKVHATLTNILFVQALTQPNIGYRQGMHELLAPILQAVHFDALPSDSPSSSGTSSELAAICDSDWVEADAWALFRVVMDRVSIWYEWRDDGPETTFSPETGAIEIKPHVAPIVKVCNRIHNDLVRSIDPLLHTALQRGGVEPQIYGIRWLRLLFTREFGLPDAMQLWDGLFAHMDQLFELAQWVCVAMLLRVRNELISGDYTMQLTRLLRYPAAPVPTSPTSSVKMSHTLALLRQALTLSGSPTVATGAAVVSENWNLFGISTSAPEASSPRIRRRRGSLDGGAGSPRTKERPNANPSQASAHPKSPSMAHGAASYVGALPSTAGSIANRLYDTSESLGINRYLLTTVSEIRRNLPDIAGTLTRAASGSSGADLNTITSASDVPDFAQIQRRQPSHVQGIPAQTVERPPWEPKTRFEMEKELTDMRALQRRLGQSVGWALDVLLAEEAKRSAPPSMSSETGDVKGSTSAREALEALSYVRDLLTAASTGSFEVLDEERLFGESELVRRHAAETMEKERQENEAKTAAAAATTKSESPSPPAPSRPPVAAVPRPHLSSRDFRGPAPSLTRSAFQPPVSPTGSVVGTPGLSMGNSAINLSFPPSRRTASPVAAQRIDEDQPRDNQLAKPRQTVGLPPPWMHTPSDFTAAVPGIAPPSSVAHAAPRPSSRSPPSYAGGYPPGPSFGYPPPASDAATAPKTHPINDPLGALP
ncbi:RabGAP/TBC [Auriculariales sp. MPI-PUGE-AT-0066]|nr:RabGAP/TBC [Auriculariales sp. MPI-PUGE-AT-0066]